MYRTPFASALDTTTQTIAVANTEQIVTFDTNIVTNKIAHSTGSFPARFTVNEAGKYLVTYAVTVTSSSANKSADTWIRINGTDVTNSNVKTSIISANDSKLVTAHIIVDMTAGQYIELIFNGNSVDVKLVAVAAGVTPTRPVTPSARLIIEKIQ